MGMASIRRFKDARTPSQHDVEPNDVSKEVRAQDESKTENQENAAEGSKEPSAKRK